MSDHCAVEFKIYCLIARSSPTKKIRFDLTDWSRFQQKINEKINLNDLTLSTPNEIDSEINKFTQTIIDTMNCSIPKQTHNSNYFRLTNDIKNLICQKNIIRRQFQRTRNPLTLSLFQTLTKQIKFEITKLRNNSFNTKIQSLKYASNQFWKFTKLIKK